MDMTEYLMSVAMYSIKYSEAFGYKEEDVSFALGRVFRNYQNDVKEYSNQELSLLVTLLSQVKEEYVQVQDDGSKLNISSKLNETKKVDGLEIGNIRFTESNGISTLLADVKNTKSSAIEMTSIMITLLDKDGKNIVEFEGLIAPIGPGESTQLNAGITSDYANAYDFSVKVKSVLYKKSYEKHSNFL